MLNAGTGNLLIQATDVDIPERGLDLVMQRTYNSQSLHDSNGDDGSEPAIFGNGWTNTYDAYMVARSNGQTISVYDIDGTRCDYAAQIDGSWKACKGEHAILEVDPNSQGCAYWWIKKSGTAYWFDSPFPGCSNPPATVGRVLAIYGRNSNNSITLNYSFLPNHPQTTQNITEIDVNHSDGQTLKMAFGQVGGGPNELASVTRPDSQKINYSYDIQGDLLEVDRPGNDAALILPETYGGQRPIQFACGPRATISLRNNNGNGNDGSCLHFDYDSNVSLIDWIVNGVLNFDPGDGFGVLQPGPTGWQTFYTANFVYGAGTGTPCGHTVSGTTTMCDSDGHSTVWTLNSRFEVSQTQAATSPSSSLITTESWDDKNNLVATTDARGSETDYAYDGNGNTIAVAVPRPLSGQDRPTSVYSYDSHNNLLSYCDPVYSSQNGLDWNSGSYNGTECPGGPGTTHYDWNSPGDGSEPYGRIHQAFSACFNASCADHFSSIIEPGFHVTYSYDSNGLPQTVTSDAIPQPGGTRTPTQIFGYDSFGNLTSYGNGVGTWTLKYDILNRLTERIDPDPGTPTSYFYYNLDGTASLTETPYQHSVAKGHAFTHDADGDVRSETVHRKNTQGMINKYYDGLDRLVDVALPPDNDYDVFQNAWITRYLYDLTEGGMVSFNGSTPYGAFGKLFEVEEVLTSGSTTYTGSRINNGTLQPIKGTQYDALDRAVGAYSILNGNNALQTTTYDGNGYYGLPMQQCKPPGNLSGLCQTLDYDKDARVTKTTYNDPSSSTRTFTYDPAGRKLTLTNGYGTQSDWFDLEGRVTNSQEPSFGTAPARYTHELYPDGKLEKLDVVPINGQAGLNQAGLFINSYNNDGTLSEQTIAYDAKQVKATVDFSYTVAGRLVRKVESGNGPNATTNFGYDGFGQMISATYPGQAQIGNYQYDPEGDLLSFGGETFTYTIRGELLGPPPAAGFFGTGGFQMANGAQVQTAPPGKLFSSVWDSRMGVMKSMKTDPGFSDESSTTFSYDGMGRLTAEAQDSCDLGSCSSIVNSGTERSYDVDDHTIDSMQTWSKTGIQTGSAANVSVYNWGPGDHPIKIGSADSTTSTPPPDSSATFDTLHWDGGHLIFSTNSGGTVDDVKVGSSADITPLDPTYQGLTFWDRGPGGAVIYCHNSTGSYGSGQVAMYPYQMGFSSSPCASGFNGPPVGSYPSSILWFTGPAPLTGKPRTGGVGQGGVVGMYRPDGISDGVNVIQGVRSFDGNAGTWTTPDAFGGMVEDPGTQKSYVWNGNNPVEYADPTGYLTIVQQQALNLWSVQLREVQSNTACTDFVLDAFKTVLGIDLRFEVDRNILVHAQGYKIFGGQSGWTNFNFAGNVNNLRNFFSASGQLHSYTPGAKLQVGDILFVGNKGGSDDHHVAMVSGVDSKGDPTSVAEATGSETVNKSWAAFTANMAQQGVEVTGYGRDEIDNSYNTQGVPLFYDQSAL